MLLIDYLDGSVALPPASSEVDSSLFFSEPTLPQAQVETCPQKLMWQAFMVEDWAEMCDKTLQTMWVAESQFL